MKIMAIVRSFPGTNLQFFKTHFLTLPNIERGFVEDTLPERTQCFIKDLLGTMISRKLEQEIL